MSVNAFGRFDMVDDEEAAEVVAGLEISKTVDLEGCSIHYGRHPEHGMIVVTQPSAGLCSLFYPADHHVALV